jgi:DNA (cytosine-5)-methyltransferase 1
MVILYFEFRFIKIYMKKIKFIDFCAWIWWGRQAAELLWFSCLWYSEIDKDAIQWYNILYWDEKNYWDLMDINPSDLPDFDLMIAWFPCQTFSIAWLRKWFDDERWQIIFWLLKILKEKDIKYFLFENVKWLLNIDNWDALKTIISELEKLWYKVKYSLQNTKDYWVPHSRERVYIYWVKNDLPLDLEQIEYINGNLKEFLIDRDEKYIFNENSSWWKTFIKYLNNKTNNWKYNLNELLKNDYLVIDTRQSDLRLYNWFVPTLRKWRHWLMYVYKWQFRKISWYEWLLLQWFSNENAKLLDSKLSTTKVLWLVGNAMSVNVIKNILNLIINKEYAR